MCDGGNLGRPGGQNRDFTLPILGKIIGRLNYDYPIPRKILKDIPPTGRLE